MLVQPKAVGEARVHHREDARGRKGFAAHHVERDDVVVAAAVLPPRGRGVGHVEQRFVERERQAVRVFHGGADAAQLAAARVETEDMVATEFALGFVAFVVGRDAVRRVGEPDRAVGFDDDVVRGVEPATFEAINDDFVGQRRQARTEARTNHRALAVRAVQQRAVVLARVAVGVLDRIAPDGHAGAGVPAQHAVIRDVAPEQALVFRHPDRAFAPDRAGAQAFKAARTSGHLVKPRIEHIQGHAAAFLGRSVGPILLPVTGTFPQWGKRALSSGFHTANITPRRSVHSPLVSVPSRGRTCLKREPDWSPANLRPLLPKRAPRRPHAAAPPRRRRLLPPRRSGRSRWPTWPRTWACRR